MLGNLTRSWLEFVVAVTLFVTALSVSSYLYFSAGQTIEQSYRTGKELDRNVHTTLVITGDYTVSGSEVLQSLYHIGQAGIDIEVDDVIFRPDLDPDRRDLSMIDVHQFYVPIYQRDATGQLVKLIFRAKS